MTTKSARKMAEIALRGARTVLGVVATKLMQDEGRRWGEVIRAAKIKAE